MGRRTWTSLAVMTGRSVLWNSRQLPSQSRPQNSIMERADRHYGAVARDGLAIFPDSEEKEILLEVIDFCIERAY